MTALWILVGVGVAGLGVVMAFLLDTPTHGFVPAGSVVRPDVPTESHPVPVEATRAEYEAQAVAEYEHLVELHRRLIDELYDHGERIVQRRAEG